MISSSNLHAIRALSGQRGEISQEQAVKALKQLGGLELREVDARKVESDLRRTLKMDRDLKATDRVMTTIAKLEAFLDESL